MKIKLLMAGLVFATSAQASEPASAIQYQREVDRTLVMAHDGEYGEISDLDLSTIDLAGRTISGLLDGRKSIDQLAGDQRKALDEARDLIRSVVRSEDKDREVCTPAFITGTRIARPECLTVEDRETRAYRQRERRWPPV